MKKSVALVITGLALNLVACSSSDGSSPIPSTDAGAKTGLSASFGAKCARCHGASGLGAGKYPKLPGKPDADTFVAFVRAGKGEMPAFSASDISDADLRSDFAYLSGN